MSATVESRALCIVRDPALRRTLRRTLSATCSQIDFADSPAEATGRARLVFVDAETRRSCSTATLAAMLEVGGRIVIVGESLEDESLVRLLRDEPLDHVIADDQVPDESELVVTSGKLITGDLFGLEKYLSWGAAVQALEVASADEKRAAVNRVAGYAEGVGARRSTVAKIESVVDELLMNAIYDAPRAHDRAEKARMGRGTGSELGGRVPPATGALLRYACDGRYFAVSVSDAYGMLEKKVIIDSLVRARTERGRPMVGGSEMGGAGLGLYFVLSAVSRFIVNVDPGKVTEVVCLIDLRCQGKEATSWARSLHIFTTDGAAARIELAAEDAAAEGADAAALAEGTGETDPAAAEPTPPAPAAGPDDDR
jgi:hypothetical protein